MLTLARYGVIMAVVGVFLGLCIVGVAIYMEEQHYWATNDSLLWFAIAFPVVVIPFQLVCWRWAKFALRK